MTIVAPNRELRHTDVAEYRVHSEHIGDGPPVVLLHGLSGSRRWWRFTAPVIARKYRVHMPELVGFGRSGRTHKLPDITGMATIIAKWMDIIGVTGAPLVGHSMGGQIAMHIAAEHTAPERLVLVSASGLPRVWSMRDAARLVAGAFPPRHWGAPSFLPTIAADAVRAGPRALLQATQHLLSDNIKPLLDRIKCPTLIVWGDLDPLVPVQHGHSLAHTIPHSRLVVIPDAAHNAMADRPAEFNRILLDFLNE
jgi:pimeloyl-ACP methyl ester carboxylesterase